MQYRTMGRTGIKLSALSFGAWLTFGSQIDEVTAREILHRAYELGVNFFDNADVYAQGRAEVVMGQAIRDLPRPSLVLSSKVFWPTMEGVNGRGLSRKHIFESCAASLRRLGTDYLDLYFCHRYDPETPLEETVRAMSDLVQQGKVLYWGSSEWRAAQIAQAIAIARAGGMAAPVVEQPQYNLLVRERVEGELAPAAGDLGIGLVTWSPLASGLLTGKYLGGVPADARMGQERHAWLRDSLTEENLAKARGLGELAAELGCTASQLAIAWLLRLPEVTSVITGATRVAQLEENLGALEVLDRLSADVLERIEAIAGGGRTVPESG
ncbi:MAG: aldo/keto reductase [Anaerolineales bacterium]